MVQRSPAALGALLLLLAGAASAAETPTVLPGARDADDSGAAAIPEHFDSREEFYGCADNVLDQARRHRAARCTASARKEHDLTQPACSLRARRQAHCGSCWAVSAAGTLADRYCVHAHKQFGFIGAAPLALSPQPLLSCASTAVVDATPYDSMGCNGGYQAEAWRFLQATGTADMSADQARKPRCARIRCWPAALRTHAPTAYRRAPRLGWSLVALRARCGGGALAARAARVFAAKPSLFRAERRPVRAQTGGCRPYWSSKCSPDPSGDGCLPCAAINECIDTGEAPTRYRVASSGAVVGSAHEMDAQVAAVQRELMRNGPVQARRSTQRC
jgi:hypothetical protein